MGHTSVYRKNRKPGYRYPGFFVLMLVVALAGRAGQLPSGLVSDVFRDSTGVAALFPASLDTAVATRIFISGVYHDLYRRVKTENGGTGAVQDKTGAYSPQARAGLIIERKKWGAAVSLRAGIVEAHWSGTDRDYSVDAAMPLKSLSVAGWAANKRGRLFAGFGYDAGFPLDYRGFSNSSLIDSLGNLFKDPRFAHLFAGTLVFQKMSLTLYETTRPFVNVSARVERVSNQAFVEIPLAAVMQEAGGTVDVSGGIGRSAFTCAYMAVSSDTALSGQNVLPAGLSGKGLRTAFRVSLGGVRFSPAAEINGWSQHFKVRGYDYTGTVPYCWLDSNKVFFVNGWVSADAPWKLRAGIFGEYLNGGSRKFGRLDPYVFSSFTFFDPVKYRIDTVAMGYHAVGLFLERNFGAFRRDSAGVMLSMSYVRSSGYADTREYDFTSWYPRLINPQTFSLLDEKLLLFAPEVRYTFLLDRFSCTAALRQLVPLSLKGGGGGGQGTEPPASAAISVRGGTTIRVRAEYQW